MVKIFYLIFLILTFATTILKANNVNNLPLCKITNGNIETLTECYGELKYKNGTSYKGEFYKKKKWGLGFLKALNGQYIGNFTNNKFDGVGVYEFNSNFTHSRFCYENWLAREFENQYVDMFPNDSKRETCFFKTKYVGSFRNQRIEGDGVFFFPNQQYLSGKWFCNDWTRCILERQYYLHDIISGKIEKDFFKIKNNQNEINQVVQNNKKKNEQKKTNQFNEKDKNKNERKRNTKEEKYTSTKLKGSFAKANARKRECKKIENYKKRKKCLKGVENFINALRSQQNKNNQGSAQSTQQGQNKKEKSFDEKWGPTNNQNQSGYQNWHDKWGWTQY